jgi:hypothetical protein
MHCPNAARKESGSAGGDDFKFMLEGLVKISKWWHGRHWGRAQARPLLLAVVATVLSGVGATVHAVPPNPTLSGPIAATAPAGDPSRNYPFLATILFPSGGGGYIEQEFFVEGTARQYGGICTTAGCLDATARTARTPTLVSSGNPYRIRMVVRRPVDSSRFNGKVIVEWFNVTNNWELDVQWYRAAEYFMREGYAYVGVGVQRAGIAGTPNGLRAWNPSRYGTVDVTAGGAITDDSLKWDIFSQVGQAIVSPAGVDPLQGLAGSRTLIATGDSQSSANLAVYINTVHQLDPIYAGFVLGGPLGTQIREDANTKVLKVSSEWDVIAFEARSRQNDSANLVSWEVAGASHSDYHNFVANSPVRFRDVGVTGILPDTTNCVDPARSRVNLYLVYHAAYEAMARWIDTGAPPPSAGRIAVNFDTNPVTVLRDQYGNALGGIRIPDVTVPVARNTGTNAGGKGGTSASACAQAGTWVPFTDATLSSLYASHEDYVQKVQDAARISVQQGFLLQEDADRLVAEARRSDVLRVTGPNGEIMVWQYRRVLSDQYFLASDIAERASLETGGGNGDWFRTDVAFTAWQNTGTFPADTVPVCRFFGAASGPTEHFFTANPAECALLKSNPRWVYEGDTFRVRALAGDACPASHETVVRFYKPGATVAASRHLYLLARDTRTDVTGWIREGPVFCALPAQ